MTPSQRHYRATIAALATLVIVVVAGLWIQQVVTR